MQEVRYLTVSALTKYLKNILETDTHLRQIYIKGEISNLTKHSRGHFYFTLKDDKAQIRVTMFANYTLKLNFNPKDGDKVRILGTMSLYEAGGSYNINCFQMEPDGIGDLFLAYEKLKNELQSKGYFDPSHKKKIPTYPKTIGVITSPTGAAVRDIIHTVKRRYPLAKVLIYPALVQGEGAKASISAQIIQANKDHLADTLIVGRGGGSIEDLWGFNELEVVMAIYGSEIPVISAVGHETDFTLSDFVSDLRAPTPTAAAELATPSKVDLIDVVVNHRLTLTKQFDAYIKNQSVRLMHLDERLAQVSPKAHIEKHKERFYNQTYLLRRNYLLQIDAKKQMFKYLDKELKAFNITYLIGFKKQNLTEKTQQLLKAYQYQTELKNNQFMKAVDALRHLNPLSLMDKGYTYTTKHQKRIESIDSIELNDTIETRLKDGVIQSVVTKKEKQTWKK